ncbi:MAG: hypothetical protein U9Q04_03830 [Campylobacterota bacterium]|nr:hypothetical protein [Campylobacterota bacterium]
MILYTALKNPTKTFIGYEISTVPFYFSKLLKLIFRQNNLNFYRQDFLDIEFQNEFLYICYLFPKAMEDIEEKIKDTDTKPTIISSTFALPTTKAQKKETLDDILKTPIYFYK